MNLCTTLASPAAEKGCKPSLRVWGLTFLENCDSLSALSLSPVVFRWPARLAPPVAPAGPRAGGGRGWLGGVLSRGMPLLPALFWLQPDEGMRMKSCLVVGFICCIFTCQIHYSKRSARQTTAVIFFDLHKAPAHGALSGSDEYYSKTSPSLLQNFDSEFGTSSQNYPPKSR